MKNDYPNATKPQSEEWVELAENDPGPAIEKLKRIHRVPSAADLHPNLAFADKPWPSHSCSLVATDVLGQLQRVRAVFVSKGFEVEADPINPLGDGKSWALIIRPTGNLPKDADPLELASQYQSECLKSAAEPVWEGDKILLPVWECGREDLVPPEHRNATQKQQSGVCLSNRRRSFIDPILKKRGWSIRDWASEARLDWHTVNDYLCGTSKPYPSTLKKLAESLGVMVEDLPE